jgi:hypothetical protein
VARAVGNRLRPKPRPLNTAHRPPPPPSLPSPPPPHPNPQLKGYDAEDLYRGTAWSVRERLIDAFENTQDYWE